MPGQLRFSRAIAVGVLAAVSVALAMLLTIRTVMGRDADDDNRQIARGAGTTIIQGGTGSPISFP
jgi:hypothetical protein